MKQAILIFLLMNCFRLLPAQSIEDLPSKEVAETQFFNNDIGLPRLCVDDIMLDKSGRIWVTTCSQSESEFAYRVMQFDGFEYHVLNIPEMEPKAGEFWRIVDVMDNGFIYGLKNSKFDAPQIFIFDPDSKTIDFFDPASNEDQIVLSLTENSPQNLLIVLKDESGFQSVELDIERKVFINRKSYSMMVPFDRGVKHRAETIVRKNRIWITSVWNDLYYIDISSNAIKKSVLPTAPNPDIKGRNSIGPSLIKFRDELYLSNPGKILGAYKLNDDTSEWELAPEINQYGQIYWMFTDAKNNLLCIYKDEQRNLSSVLFDTDGGVQNYTSSFRNVQDVNGIFSNDFTKQVIIGSSRGIVAVKMKEDYGIQGHLIEKSSRAGIELPNGKIIFTRGSEWIELTKDGQRFEMIRPPRNPPTSQPLRGVGSSRSVFYSPDSSIWFSAYGIQTYDWKKRESQLVIDEASRFIDVLSDGRIVHHSNDFLFLTDLERDIKTTFQQNGVPVKMPDSPQDLIVSRDDKLWFATASGIHIFDFENEVHEVLSSDQGFSDPRFISLHEAKDGRIWCGTVFDGVQIYDRQKKTVQIINRDAGLSNNTVASISEDLDGDFWIATFDGLNLLDAKGKVLAIFDETNGLPSQEFDRSAHLITKDGIIWLGTFLGPIRIDPNYVKSKLDQEQIPKIFLNSLKYVDKSDDKERTLKYTPKQSIDLSANRRYLQAEFGLSNYTQTAENQFAFQIEGDEEWTFMGNQRRLNFNNLPIGKYSIWVKGADHQGIWSEPLAIQLNVADFFYRQLWFYAIILGIISFGTIIWINRLRTERKRLAKLVQKRTARIRKDKETIEHQTMELLKLDQAKSDFFTNISHELRTPLTVIGGMVSQIKKNPQRWTEQGIELIGRNNENLLSLVNQILELRKLESGEMKLDLNRGDVIQFLKMANESFDSLAKSKKVNMHFHADEDELLVDYDPDKLIKVISNLLSNAIKFTPEGGNVYFSVWKDDLEHGSRLNMQVRDDGIGIPEDQQEKVFERFAQVRNLATKAKQGTGIGLTLTAELVKLMEGEISLKSKEGEGSTFKVVIPIRQSNQMTAQFPEDNIQKEIVIDQVSEEKNEAIEIASAILDEEQDEKLPLILVCEDNPDVATYILSCISDAYRTLLAYDGAKGIELAFEHTPDLIISDVMMPEKDGYELTETLKGDVRTSHIPIVLLTARADVESKLAGLRRGADVYLSKPFNPEELEVRLEKLLEIRSRLQSRYSTFKEELPSEEPEFAQEDAFIIQLRERILDNIDDDTFGIPEICRAMGVSRSNLHNKLKSLTGKSTSHFIRYIRLEKAKELMQNPNLNISEIAYDVGFNTLKYFSNVFKEETGVSPTEYRENI